MDYGEFRTELLSDLSEGIGGSDLKTRYLETVCSDLIDFDQILDFVSFSFEGVGYRGRKLSIDGYSFESDDGTLNLFYCYFTGSAEMPTITRTDIEKICARVRNFLEACFDGSVLDVVVDENGETIDTIGTIISLEDKVQRVRIHVVTDAIRGDREIKMALVDIGDSPCTVSLWDTKAYCDLLLSKPEKEKVIIDFSDFGYDGIRCIEARNIGSGSIYDAYLCIMPGKLLSDLYTKYGARLLESNVRSFLSSKKKVNAGMRDTIMTVPERFFAYNNGLSTTASGIDVVKDDEGYKITRIEDLQIVNGGQTTALINFLDRNPKFDPDLDSVFVPMKLCVILGDAPPDFVPRISQYSNSQTAVSSADFFSNSDFNIKLEKISRRLLAPPRPGSVIQTKWFYERAAGSYMQAQAFMSSSEKSEFLKTNPKNQRITKTDLAKYRNTYARIPHVVSKGTSASMAEFVKAAKKLWGDEETISGTVPGARINDNYYKESVAIAIIFKDLERSISNKELAPWYNSGYRANLVTYSIAKLVDLLEDCGQSINLDLVWRNQSVSDVLRQQLLLIAEKTLLTIQDPKRKVDDVREWCKRPECWESIRSMQVDLLGLGNAIIRKKTGSYETKRVTREERTRTIDAIKSDIVTKGDDYWHKALEWGTERGILGKSDRDLMTIAANIHYRGKPPGDKQTLAIWKVYEKLRDAGFDQ